MARVCCRAFTAVRMTKAGNVSETKTDIGLDRRAKFSVEDRKAQFDAATKVKALFNDESALYGSVFWSCAQASRRPPVRCRLSDASAEIADRFRRRSRCRPQTRSWATSGRGSCDQLVKRDLRGAHRPALRGDSLASKGNRLNIRSGGHDCAPAWPTTGDATNDFEAGERQKTY